LLTELTSNVATASAFLPVVAAVAIGIGQNPLMLAVPAVLAASCAFMLPVATPPNAVVYGSGFLTIPQMVRAGGVLNLIFVLLLTAFAYTLVTLVFDVQLGVVPVWAQ
jgi:sodium-dependent dicarboxylate transporter 2/3/5